MSGRNWDRVRVEARQAHEPLQTGGQYLAERKPLTPKQANFIRKLRVQVGKADTPMPKTSREGRVLIDQLLAERNGDVRRRHAELDARFGTSVSGDA